MFAMYTKKMHSADAACAPACQSARFENIALNLDTAVEAVSVLILGVLVLISVIVRILVPV